MLSVDMSKMPNGAQLLFIVLAVILVALGLRAAADIINSIALALVLAISIAPVMNWLIKRGLPRMVALIIVATLVILAVLLLVIVIIVSVQNVSDSLPKYQDSLQELQDEIVTTMDGYGVDISDVRNSETFSAENVVSSAISAASAVVSAMSSWFFMLVLVVYMLLEAIDFPEKIKKTLKAGSPMPGQLSKVSDSLRSYISLTVWLGALNAVIMTVIMFVLGVDFALLWGILVFIMSFIPYVGFVIALVPPIALSLLESGWTEAIILLALFLIVNTLIDNVFKPRIMGKGLELSPLVIMLSLFVWAWVLGPMGAILAVPMTIILKGLFLETSPDTRWLANLMMPSEEILTETADEKQ